jgi:hypothetical protein
MVLFFLFVVWLEEEGEACLSSPLQALEDALDPAFSSFGRLLLNMWVEKVP